MKRIPLHAKSIEIEFTNLVTHDVCFRITIPICTQVRVSVSEMYKKLKPGIAESENIPLSKLSAKHRVRAAGVQEGRILYEWRGGISLDVPYDVDAYDYKIILAQLKVLEMRFDRPTKKLHHER